MRQGWVFWDEKNPFFGIRLRFNCWNYMCMWLYTYHKYKCLQNLYICMYIYRYTCACDKKMCVGLISVTRKLQGNSSRNIFLNYRGKSISLKREALQWYGWWLMANSLRSPPIECSSEKYARKFGSPQIGMKMKNVWNYHLECIYLEPICPLFWGIKTRVI